MLQIGSSSMRADLASGLLITLLSASIATAQVSTTVDTQQAEDNFSQLMNFCQTGENGKVLVMKAIEHLLKSK
jgi:hypothetical protein